ncbi:hypothetical protein HPP92_017783 [Vanilla planifolia]|uniref:Pentatricopeptide repeat-containing protein n=1 Tax=Vanilla planifolia TaxID=51239 RepID=A0A835QC74_VANPL|nr:hypothetical protein HPP92_017783 [Vanilla planifolia]
MGFGPRRLLFLFHYSSSAREEISSTFPAAAASTSALVSSAESILREQRSRSRWNFLRSILPANGISPDEASWIVIRLRNNPRLALHFFLWSRDRALCQHNLSSYSTIVHVLARSRLRSSALSLLRTALWSFTDSRPRCILQTVARTYRVCDSAPFVFDLLIQAYLLSLKLDDALSITRVLRSRGIYPLTSTANFIIRSASKLRGSAAAVELYHELFSNIRPNLQTFNTLLLALYRDGSTEKSREILEQMGRFDCKPNAYTYSILMAGFCDKANVGEARRLWDEMAERGIEPDTIAYNTLIGSYCMMGDVVVADELFRQMVMREMEPTSTTFELLINGHYRAGAAGNVEAALLLYADMKHRGFRPEVETVDKMLDQMCEKGRVGQAVQMLREEMRREEFAPSRRSYELLIKSLCRHGRMEEALKLQAEMTGRGLEADAEIYGAFICGYHNAGDLQKADCLRKELVQFSLEGKCNEMPS